MRVPIRIANPAEPREAIPVPGALIDTGATWTVLPRRYAEELQLAVVEQWAVRTAIGVQQMDQCLAWLEIQGKRLIDSVLLTDTYPDVIIGVTTLEKMGFAVDPVSERLIESELLLL